MSQPRWRGLSHQEVYDRVHAGPGPYVSQGAVAAWNDAEATLRRIDGDLAAAMRKAGGWEGDAAEATQDGLTPLGRWAVGAADAAGRAALSLQEHQEQVATVRAAMPEPGPEVSEDPPFSLNDPGTDPFNQDAWAADSAASAEQANQAFYVMDNYATNTGLIQKWIPVWTAPPTVTVAVASAAAAASAGRGRAVGGSHTRTSDLATVVPAAAVPGAGGAAAPGFDAVPAGATAGSVAPSFGAVPGGGATGTGTAGPTTTGGRAGPAQFPSGSAASLPGGGGEPSSGDGLAGGTTAGTGRPSPSGWRDLPALGSGDASGTGSATGAATPGRWSPFATAVPGGGGAAPGRWSPTSAGDPSRPGQRAGWSPSGSDAAWDESGSRSGATGSGLDGSGRSASATGRGGPVLDEPGSTARGGASGLGGGSTGEPVLRGGGASAAATDRPGYLPMSGMGSGAGSESTHPRPTFLVDDSGAFVDERWFTEAVITPDDPLPWS